MTSNKISFIKGGKYVTDSTIVSKLNWGISDHIETIVPTSHCSQGIANGAKTWEMQKIYVLPYLNSTKYIDWYYILAYQNSLMLSSLEQ